jgi:hypothetical protein
MYSVSISAAPCLPLGNSPHVFGHVPKISLLPERYVTAIGPVFLLLDTCTVFNMIEPLLLYVKHKTTIKTWRRYIHTKDYGLFIVAAPT